MAAMTNQKHRRFSFGFYLRTKGQTRFFGWGNPFAKKDEYQVSSLADWLRMMHSANSDLQGTSSAQSKEELSANKTFLHWQEST